MAAEVAEGLGDGGGDEGVVGAAEEDGVGGGAGEGFGEINAEDVAGDGVVGPAFFDEGDEKRTGHFGSVKMKGGAGVAVGVGGDGGGGGENEDVGVRFG